MNSEAAWPVAFLQIRYFVSLKNNIKLSRSGSVGVVTRSADRRVRCSISSTGKTSLSSTNVHRAVRPTQASIRWVPGSFPRVKATGGVKSPTHLHPTPMLKIT